MVAEQQASKITTVGEDSEWYTVLVLPFVTDLTCKFLPAFSMLKSTFAVCCMMSDMNKWKRYRMKNKLLGATQGKLQEHRVR